VPVEKEMIQPKASSSNKNKAQKKDVEMEQITSSYVK